MPQDPPPIAEPRQIYLLRFFFCVLVFLCSSSAAVGETAANAAAQSASQPGQLANSVLDAVVRVCLLAFHFFLCIRSRYKDLCVLSQASFVGTSFCFLIVSLCNACAVLLCSESHSAGIQRPGRAEPSTAPSCCLAFWHPVPIGEHRQHLH